MDYGALLPEIALLIGAVAVLLTGSYLPRRRQWPTLLIAAAALTTAIVAGIVQALQPPTTVFTGSFALDAGSAAVRILAPAATAAVIVLGQPELRRTARESETIALLLLATLGALVVAGADDLLVLATGFLLSSIPLYGLIGITRSAAAAEAVTKTYLQGALFGVTMLGGIALLFAAAGATAYPSLNAAVATAPPVVVALGAIAVTVGLLFEAGATPAHFWVPDATQASSRAVGAFLTTVPKLAALVALLRLVTTLQPAVDLPLVIAVVASASMTIGNLAAFWQQDVRRLLGWSTVSQVGYLLLAVTAGAAVPAAGGALLAYLAGYTATNLTAFAVVAALPDRATIDHWRGAARAHPALTGTLVVALLSLVGTPPTAVFFGKLAVFIAAWDAGYGWLVAIAAINTVVSLFYYLRWIVAAVGRTDAAPDAAERAPGGLALVLGAATLALGAATVLLLGPNLTLV